MTKYKIIHLQVLPILSGVQNSMLDIITRLDSKKYDITVLCQAEGDLTAVLRLKGIKYIILPELRREINPYFDILALYKLYKLFKEHNYDIVHTHSSKPGIIGRLAAKAAGIKGIVHTVQGFAFHQHSLRLKVFLVGLLEKVAGMVSHKVIFVNNQDRRMAGQLKLIPEQKMITIYNGIDLSLYKYQNRAINIDYAAEIEKNRALVAMVARLWKQKAPQYLIASIPKVVQEFPTAKFLLVGDGPLKEDLEKQCEELSIRENVLFLGWRKDVVDLLKIIDVFVLPSLWEGLPISILEAMAAAKPVVATNIKGNNELVVHGKTGFLVEPQNSDQIAEYVIKLLRDRSLAQKMGKMGYLRVKEEFEIKKTVQQINELYVTLLNGKKPHFTSNDLFELNQKTVA